MNIVFADPDWLWLLGGLVPLLLGLLLWLRRWLRVDTGSLLIWRRAARKNAALPRRFTLGPFVLLVFAAGILPVLALAGPVLMRGGEVVTVVVDTAPASGFSAMGEEFASAISALRAGNPSLELRIYSPAQARSIPASSTLSALSSDVEFAPAVLLSALLAAEPEQRFVWLSTRRPGITSPRLTEFPLVRTPSGGRLLEVWDEAGHFHAAIYNDADRDADFTVMHNGEVAAAGHLPAGRGGVFAGAGAMGVAPGREYVLVRGTSEQGREVDRLSVPPVQQAYLTPQVMARYPELELALRAAGSGITGDMRAADWLFVSEAVALQPGQHVMYVSPTASIGGLFYSGASFPATYALVPSAFMRDFPEASLRGIAGERLREVYLPTGARAVIEAGSGGAASPFLAQLPESASGGVAFFLADIPQKWARGPGLAICIDWLLRRGRSFQGRGAQAQNYYGEGLPAGDKFTLEDGAEAVLRVHSGWLVAALAGVAFIALSIMELRRFRVLSGKSRVC